MMQKEGLEVIGEGLEMVMMGMMMEEWDYLKLRRIEVRRRAHMVREEGK